MSPASSPLRLTAERTAPACEQESAGIDARSQGAARTRRGPASPPALTVGVDPGDRLRSHGCLPWLCARTWFHTMSADKERTYEANQSLKRCLVEGRAHASLVHHGDRRWPGESTDLQTSCRTSITASSTKRNSTSSPTTGASASSWTRATAKGLSALALQGAVDLMVAARGGVVEGYPHDTDGKKKPVLYNGTRTLFEDEDFEFVRSKGAGNCVMRRTLP